MITTRWKDSQTQDFDQIIRQFLNVTTDDNNNLDSVTSCSNWHVDKVFDSNQCLELNNKNISFNLFKYKFDQISSGTQPIEDRTNNGIFSSNDFFVWLIGKVYSGDNIIEASYLIKRKLEQYLLILKNIKALC